MLNAIGTAFKGLFTVIVAIALISVVIAGFIFMSDSPLIGFSIIIGGAILIILSAGMVSIFINIRDDLHDIKKLLNNENVGYVKQKRCYNCSTELNEDIPNCPNCKGNDFRSID